MECVGYGRKWCEGGKREKREEGSDWLILGEFGKKCIAVDAKVDAKFEIFYSKNAQYY